MIKSTISPSQGLPLINLLPYLAQTQLAAPRGVCSPSLHVGSYFANLVSEEHPLLLQMVSCEYLNINISVSNRGQWKFVWQNLTFSREPKNLKERFLALGFFLMFSNQNTFLISHLQIPMHWILWIFTPTKDCTERRRQCSTATVLPEALQMLKELEVVRNSGESAVLCLNIWMPHGKQVLVLEMQTGWYSCLQVGVSGSLMYGSVSLRESEIPISC